MKRLRIAYDVIVIGGGMAGISAAIASARRGAKTALIQDRPVLGGNASSEVRMHVVGASRQKGGSTRPNLRETGIIEELLLENKAKNPEYSYGIFDTALWEKVNAEPNLDLYLNCYAYDVRTEGRKILSVEARQMTTEKEFIFTAKEFIDCSGDGFISAKAGASYMFGREGKSVFGEAHAVEKSDCVTMGNSIMFRALDAGHPTEFVRPSWAYDYSKEEWVQKQKWEEITSGYWWIEVGGTEWNVVDDAELTRDEMLKIIFGVWDYIKNHSKRKDELTNYYVDWVGYIPAKRESRRFIGDYVLVEEDVVENRTFDDAIAYGGWHLDAHRPEGFYAFIHNKPWEGDDTVVYDGIYTIPYRCCYSKDFDNLFLGGRIMSASHRAFSSTRVMATCAVQAQAAGVAAVMAMERGVSAAGLLESVQELQQELLKAGCYIPNVRNQDEKDFARRATVTASSEKEPAKNVVNGISRPVGENSNSWESLAKDKEPTLSLCWEKPVPLKELILTFDSNLSSEITMTLSDWFKNKQSPFPPQTLVKDYEVVGRLNGKELYRKKMTNNYQRVNTVYLAETPVDEIEIQVRSTRGSETARICEIRAY